MFAMMTDGIEHLGINPGIASNRKICVQENSQVFNNLTFSTSKTEQQDDISNADLVSQPLHARNLKMEERRGKSSHELSIRDRKETQLRNFGIGTPNKVVSNSSSACELGGLAGLCQACLLSNLSLSDKNYVLRRGDDSCEVEYSAHEVRLSAEQNSDLLGQFLVAGEAMKISMDIKRRHQQGTFHFSPKRPLKVCGRKLLILDINGLLADIVSPPPKDYKADRTIARRAVFKRPFCIDFLKFCFERFDVGIWSSRTKKNVARVVDYLLGDMKHKLLFCWDLSHCTATKFRTLENRHKIVVFKEVRRLWEKYDPDLPWEEGDYDESNTLLLDDSPYKALLNPPHTAVFPQSYKFQHENDASLGIGGDLRVYLEELAAASDIQQYVKHHPFGQSAISEESSSWGFYLSALSTVAPRQNRYSRSFPYSSKVRHTALRPSTVKKLETTSINCYCSESPYT